MKECNHDFTDDDSDYCAKGCGKHKNHYAIEKLQAENKDLRRRISKEKEDLIKQIKYFISEDMNMKKRLWQKQIWRIYFGMNLNYMPYGFYFNSNTQKLIGFY